MADQIQLQACKRCRTRKIKCDKLSPRCTGCAKAEAECIIVDAATREELTREQVASLEEREASLRAACLDLADTETVPSGASKTQHTYVGEASGISFLETVFSSPQWTEPKAQLLKQLFSGPKVQEPNVQAASLPSREAASYLVQAYLSGSHLQKPFLLTKHIYALVDRIYGSASVHTEAAPQDRFRLLMICAIAAVTLQARGLIEQHPYSFFLAARALTAHIPLIGCLDAVQNLLLVVRFGIYFHTGISVWELTRLCMCSCVELELHLNPLLPMDPLEEQHRRRIFWECYVMDRYSSTTLGRPFCISDEDIEVKLPALLSDEEVESRRAGHLDEARPQDYLVPTSMQVFVSCVKLRCITSRIHTAFFQRDRKPPAPITAVDILAAGDVYAKFQTLCESLENWRLDAPVFLHPESLYQRQEWYDFMAEKERLFLTRGAMEALPSHQKAPPERLVSLCIESATKTIALYSGMYAAKQINCTRGYFQILFTAGLSLAYFSSLSHSVGSARVDVSTITDCARILRLLSKTLADARRLCRVFDMVCESLLPEYATQTGYRPVMNTEQHEQSFQQLAGAGTTSNDDEYDLPVLNWPFGAGSELWESHGILDPNSLAVPWISDMEAFAGQYACGDFAADNFLFDQDDWNAFDFQHSGLYG